MTDGELVRQTIGGDRAACEALVRRWSARVLALCHARVGRLHAAEDLAQESLLRALRALNTLATPDKFGSWLYGIAVRVCLDWHKAKQTSQTPFSTLAPERGLEERLATDAVTTEEAVDRADDLRQLLAAVDELPEKQREVLLLFYYQELSYRDLAELLGVSTATINARLTQARTLLRERLGSSRR